jgi:hypothetical protein
MKLIVAFIFAALAVHAQDSYSTLRPIAEKFSRAIVDYDMELYAKMTYAPIIEMAGGHEIYKDMTKSYKDGMVNAGMMIIESNVDSITQVVMSQNELHCFIRMHQVTKMKENYFEGHTYALAISKDNGETWSFVDLETFDEVGLKDFVSTYDSSKLKFPPAANLVLVERK